MLRVVEAGIERWALRSPFRIARGTRTAVEVVVATIVEDGVVGRGEATPTGHFGQTPSSVLAQIAAVRSAVEAGAGREDLLDLMPSGSARNAVDAALWDLEARQAGHGQGAPGGTPARLVSARTISIATPEEMGAAASKLSHVRLVKVKVDGYDPASCLRAVRACLPQATLIVDANESWTPALLAGMQPVLAELRIALLEQPLPAGDDDNLAGLGGRVPICADESCHVAADVERLQGHYDFVNIKLDKSGGLTEALRLLEAARAAGMGVMAGCMLSTSLGIAPALRVAALSDYADLDGPWWLAEDRLGGATFEEDGGVVPLQRGFWGDGG